MGCTLYRWPRLDLDASAFLLAANGKVRSDADFIFYNQMRAVDGSVEHTGDNRTGEGDGDDESLLVDLSKVAADIDKIVITVTIHEADQRRQNFGRYRTLSFAWSTPRPT